MSNPQNKGINQSQSNDAAESLTKVSSYANSKKSKNAGKTDTQRPAKVKDKQKAKQECADLIKKLPNTENDTEPSSQKSILAQTKETAKLGSKDVQQKTNNPKAAKNDDKLCKCTILIMNANGPQDDKGQIPDRRREVIRNTVRIAVPSIVLFQEFPWVKLDKSWQADNTLCKYRYKGHKQASIIYDKTIFSVEDLQQNTIDGILSSLKRVMNINLGKIIPQDFMPVPSMCISKVKSLTAPVMEFLCISWHGPHNGKKVNEKIEYFEYFMEFLRRLDTDIILPILVGGDFNVERDIIESKVTKPFVLRPYTPSMRRKPNVIDFFITTEDLIWERIGWMDLKEMMDIISPENIFDHDPIVGHLSGCMLTQPHTNICSTCGRWQKPTELCAGDQTNAHFTNYVSGTCSLCRSASEMLNAHVQPTEKTRARVTDLLASSNIETRGGSEGYTQ